MANISTATHAATVPLEHTATVRIPLRAANALRIRSRPLDQVAVQRALLAQRPTLYVGPFSRRITTNYDSRDLKPAPCFALPVNSSMETRAVPARQEQ
jgi:hypothetical protein